MTFVESPELAEWCLPLAFPNPISAIRELLSQVESFFL